MPVLVNMFGSFLVHLSSLINPSFWPAIECIKMPTLFSLPLELLEAIASNLDQKGISAWVRTNRHLYLLFNCCLYRYNKEHFRGSALLWGARKEQIRTVQYSIQEGFDIHVKDKSGPYDVTALDMALSTRNYAMIKLLIENGAMDVTHHFDVAFSWPLFHSCHTIIRQKSSNDKHELKALRAVAKMGQEELIDLVSRKEQKDVIQLYSPIWSTLVEAVDVCEANVSIFRLILENTKNKILTNLDVHLTYAQLGGCDLTLKVFLEGGSYPRIPSKGSRHGSFPW